MASPAVPQPPGPAEGDGEVEYRMGKKVTALRYNEQDGTVDVRYVDIATGDEATITVDLVIGADGVNSAEGSDRP